MLAKLGDLRWPFIAAAAAIMALTVAHEVSGGESYDRLDRLIAGLIMGALLVVVLYAVMRTVAVRRGEPTP